MTVASPDTWIVAYDIRSPRRLRRVHMVLSREGYAAQYSIFAVSAAEPRLDRILARVDAEIDRANDDVRAYHLGASCQVWTLGRQALPEGIYLQAPEAVQALLGCVHEADVEPEPAVPDPP